MREFGSFFQNVFNRQYDAFLLGYSYGGLDPENGREFWYSKSSLADYKNPKVDELFDQGDSTTDTAKATAIRLKDVAQLESEAQARSETMVLPVVLMFAGFLVLIGYPALAALNGNVLATLSTVTSFFGLTPGAFGPGAADIGVGESAELH